MTDASVMRKVEVSTVQSTRLFLTRLATLIARKRLTVRFAHMQELAYIEDGKRISISTKRVPIEDIQTDPSILALYKGFTYHEVGHVRFDSYRRNPDWKLRESLNLLRDQQLESRFVAKYPGVADYFRLIVAKFLDPKDKNTYGLVYGRRVYLPKKMIRTARKSFVKKWGEYVTSRVEQIIDEYLLTTDEDKCDDLATQLNKLFNAPEGLKDLIQNIIDDSPGRGRSNEPLKDQTRVEKNDTDEANEILTSKMNDETDEGEVRDDGDEFDEFDSESNDSSSDPVTSVSKDNSESGEGDVESDLHDIIDEIIEDALDSVSDDHKHDMDFINDDEDHGRGDSKRYDSVEKGWGKTQTISFDDTDVEVKSLTEELKKMVNDLRGGYLAGHKRGIPDFPVIKRNEAKGVRDTKIFKQFKPSRLAKVKIAMSVVIDVSGSLSENREAIYRATSILMRAMQTLPNVKFNLIYFAAASDISIKFRHPKKSINTFDVKNVGGSTHIEGALQSVISEFQTLSPQYKKYCFIISDGQWYDSAAPRLFQTIRKMGVKLVYVRAGRTVDHGSTPWSFVTREVIHGVDDAQRVLKEICTTIVKDNLKEVTKR